MKKVIAILICLGLALSGCAFLQNLPGFVGKAQEWICDPAADQVLDAIAALSFIQGNPAIAAGIGAGIEVFRNIRDKVCVSLPQLKDALEKFDAAVGALQVKGVRYAKVPELKALRAGVK